LVIVGHDFLPFKLNVDLFQIFLELLEKGFIVRNFPGLRQKFCLRRIGIQLPDVIGIYCTH